MHQLNAIYLYKQHVKEIDASLPLPNCVNNRYHVADSVWVKATHS